MSDFLYDDYFADDKEGIAETVTVRGRDIPVRLRSSITLSERAKAKNAAIKKHLNAKGDMIIDGVDEDELQAQLLAVMVTEWPFKRNGQLVPITVDNCRKLDSMVADAITIKIKSIIEGPTEAALAPFEQPSDEDLRGAEAPAR